MSQEKDRLLQTEPIVEVHLDAGVFSWLNEMIAAKHAQRTYRDWLPWYDSLVQRAYEQFTTANPSQPEPEPAYLKHGEPEGVRVARKRRSKAISTPPPTSNKRVIRRRG